MNPLRIGVDIDGVLADFNAGFIPRCSDVTGRDLFGPGYVPTTWNYPESVGYTSEEVSKVWTSITADPWFWRDLPAYPHTASVLRYLAEMQGIGHDVYFITARPGVVAKRQTEQWLEKQLRRESLNPGHCTVLISSAKGACANALNLDVYVDDRVENVLDVWEKQGAAYLFDQPWNRHDESLNDVRVTSIVDAIEREREEHHGWSESK